VTTTPPGPYEHLLVDRDGPVGIVTLNRPQQLNALFTPLVRELVAALQAFDADQTIRAIVLTGGEKVFAAGADIREMADQSAVEMLTRNTDGLWERVKTISKPVIAAVSGYALGGGCELAMVCDIILASETARFGQPEINIGLIPGAGGTQRLTRAVGKFKAMEMIMTGRWIDAAEAERRGLANRVVPVESLLAEAVALGKELATRPPVTLRLAKEAVNKAFETTIAEGLDFERRSFFFLFASNDSKEGMRAFLEKRKPEYQGK
jgi:enoyl-CoA hydratase